DRQRKVGQRGKHLIRLQIGNEAALQQRALQRGEVTPRIAAVDLRRVRELDRGRHTTSASESRSRSNTQYPAKKITIDAPPIASSHHLWPNAFSGGNRIYWYAQTK